jgi:hypothetical protein
VRERAPPPDAQGYGGRVQRASIFEPRGGFGGGLRSWSNGEAFRSKLAQAIDSVGPGREALMLRRIALRVAHERADSARTATGIEGALRDLPKPDSRAPRCAPRKSFEKHKPTLHLKRFSRACRMNRPNPTSHVHTRTLCDPKQH